MSTNATRQAAFRARMHAQGKRQLTLWVTPNQAHAIKAFVRDRRPLAPPAQPPRLDLPTRPPLPVTAHSSPVPPLPVTPDMGETHDDRTLVRQALAEGIEPRFKKVVLPVHRDRWQIFVGPHPVGEVWKAPSGYGWKGLQTLRRSWLDALSPLEARTRQQVTQAVLASLGS